MLKATPPLTLCVVAIGTAASAGDMVQMDRGVTTKGLRALRVAQHDSIGSLLYEVRAAFAEAFTAAMFAQAESYYPDHHRCLLITTPAS